MAKLKSEHDPLSPPPMSILGLVAVMAGLELMFSAGSAGLFGGPDAERWRIFAIVDYGFLEQAAREQAGIRGFFSENGIRIFAYPFIHYTFTDALISTVLLLAIGRLVGEFQTDAFLIAVFFLGSAAGAICYGLLPSADLPLVGSAPGLFGILGAFTCIALTRPQGPIFQLTIGIPIALFGVQLLGSFLFGMPPVWMADAGAYFAGAAFWVILFFGFRGLGIKR